jgi:hypothetical protein
MVNGLAERHASDAPVRTVDFDAVEAGLDGVLGGLSVQSHVLLHLVDGERLGQRTLCSVGALVLSLGDPDVRRGHIGVAALLGEDVGVGGATEGPELGVDEGLAVVDGIGDALPGLDLLGLPQSGNAVWASVMCLAVQRGDALRVAAGFLGDERRLAD